MASAAPLKDIDEQFLQCCICMEQLKEPKMLPCLHRYCRDCLKKVFKGAKAIECPTCREKHTLPEEGIDGLKTDFNTKNIIEFIQLQSSVKIDPLRTCIHCRKRLEASAFCFKCNDFLCHGCHEFHASSMMVNDHHPHIFSLSEAEARNLTIQKLSSLKEAPRCRAHPGKLSELCCTTCGNLPICMPCTYGAHRGHHLEEVTSLAKIERERLTSKVADLMQYKKNIQKMQEEIKRSKEKLCMTVDKEKQKLQEELNAEEEAIKTEIHRTDEQLKIKQIEVELKKKTSSQKQKLEKEMKEMNEKYEKLCEKERKKADAEFKKLQAESETEKEQLQEGLKVIKKNIKELLASLKTQEEENTQKFQELANHFDDITNRFETVTTTASSILAAEHEWTDVQCIPDICKAIDPLIEELKKDHPELRTLSDITIRHVPSFTSRKGTVNIDEKESVIHIKGLTRGWYVNSIISHKTESLVISGRASTEQESHITKIDMEGNLMKQQILKSSSAQSWRYCNFLSQSHIASVCTSKEIGVYDDRDGSYRATVINKVIKNCPQNLWAYAVTTDPFNDHFMVGSNQRDVYIFNSQLEYIKTLTLPKIVQSARDMIVHKLFYHKCILLVCDYIGKRAFAVTMEKSDSQLTYEFAKPNIDGSDWIPHSVCSDQRGYIYILWLHGDSTNGRVIIVQYSQDGGLIQSVRHVDRAHYAECLTVVGTQNGEKIVVPTFNTGLLITYGLK